MPPKARITKDMILDTVLKLTRESGFETVNARSIAGRLQCSTRPIFTRYENMVELKKDFLAFAYGYYVSYVNHFGESENVNPCLVFPLSYIAFAKEETHLFKLLFISDMDLDMAEAKDFYDEIDNVKNAERFSEAIGMDLERSKVIFLDLFLYTHGIAVLTAAKKLNLGRKSAETMLEHVLSSWIG